MSESAAQSYQELQELTRIVSSVAPKYRKIVSQKQLESSESGKAKLFRALLFAPSATERQSALTSLQVEPRAKTYRSTKSKLKLSLLWTLLDLDLGRAKYSQYLQDVYVLHQWGFICKILALLGARKLAAKYASKFIGKAYALEEWAIALDFIVALRTYAAATGKQAAFQKYRQKYAEVLDFANATNHAEAHVEQTQLTFGRSGAEKPEMIDEVERACSDVSELARRLGTFKLSFTALRLRAFSQQLQLDYQETLRIANEAHALLDAYPQFDNRARRFEYEIKRLYCYIRLSELDKAKESVDECEKLVLPSENNWFPFKELEFQYLMHSEMFDRAVSLCNEVRANARYERLNDNVKQRWQLYCMYADYATGSPISMQTAKDFLASMPTHSADKAGYNVAILVLHVLLLLERREYSAVLERIDALKTYRKRYLKGKENSQTDIFFRMLLLLETSFERRNVQERAIKLSRKLDVSIEEVTIQGVQILPYSWVWQRILSRLN